MNMFGRIAVSAIAAMGASAAVLGAAPAVAQGGQELAGAPGFRGPERGGGREFEFSAIMGQRVDAAKETLRYRGFTHARNIRVDGRQYDLWWSGRSCVGFTSYNGRVTDVRAFRDEECGYYGGGGGGRPGGGWGGGPGGGWGGFNPRDLEGLRVDSAKDVLRDRGYRHQRNIREDGRQYDLWWNNRTCVGFTSYRGTVTDARAFNDRECSQGAGGPGWGGRFEPRRLEGVSVDAAKSVLRDEGFGYARSIRIGGRQYDLWRSREHRNGCVGFASYNGRVTDARAFDEDECW
jgi:hypothetical protein